MELSLDDLAQEVIEALSDVDVYNEGERIYSNYQKVTGWIIRLQEIHNQIALKEILGTASPQLKKFRTSVLDTTIERLEKVSVYESRRITAYALEMELQKH